MHHSPLLLSSLFLAFTLGCPAGDPAKDGDPTKDTGTTDICDFPVDWHPDSDSDGFGDADTEAQQGCDAPEPGWVSNGDDCDDTLAGVNPDALEICDGIDNNCDQVTDDPADLGTFYADGDGDTYGDVNDTVEACLDTAPSGYVADNTDCDDTLADVNPGAEEVCNDIDDNCDGTVNDEGCPDQDGDGYDNTVDCDDSDASIHPGATELCDGIDSDCDGSEATNQVELDDLTNSTYNVDVSAAWTSGTAASPASITLSNNQHARVCPGTYYVAVDSYAGDNSITGATGNAAEVVLDGGGVNTVLSLYDDLHSNLLEVVDLTIANGSGTDGGNLSCSVQNGNRAPTFTLDNVIVTGGFASGDGGGLYGEDCGANITDSTFSNNTSIGKGGAMILHGITISNTVISGNQSGTYGGGIYTDMSGNSCGMFNSTLTDTWFLANTAAIGGSALYLTSTAGGPGGPGATDWIEMSCTTPGSGGFHGNQSPGWGAIVLSSRWNGFDLQGSSRFKVTEGFPCDFGEPGTTDDNSPNDVYVRGVGTYDYGDGRTINCSSSNWANTDSGSCSATDGL